MKMTQESAYTAEQTKKCDTTQICLAALQRRKSDCEKTGQATTSSPVLRPREGETSARKCETFDYRVSARQLPDLGTALKQPQVKCSARH